MLGFTRDFHGKRYFTCGLVAARYRRNPRTIKRWLADPDLGFPAPDLTIHGKSYWSEEALDAFDDALRAKAVAA